MKLTNMEIFGVLLTVLVIFGGILMPSEAVGADTPEEKAKRLIVKVNCEGSSGGGIIIGKINEAAFIVTANHVVEKKSDCRVEFEFYEHVDIPVKILEQYPRPLDIALLRAKLPENFPGDKIPVSNFLGDTTKEGQNLHLVGHPGGDGWVSPNQEIKLQKKNHYLGTFRFNYPCLPGHSGGGVFSKEWRLLGMISDQDGYECIARDIGSIMVQLPEHIFQINYSNIGLYDIIRKLTSKSSEIVVGILTQMTGPLAPYSELERIVAYLVYQKATNENSWKKTRHIVFDVDRGTANILMNIERLKAERCQLIIVDSSVGNQGTIEKMIQQKGMEAFLVKRGELFDP